jgi:hypothetical protein
METEYVSFDRPRVAAVRMTRGPWCIGSFAASIRQEPLDAHTTRVEYTFSVATRPRWLAWLLDPLAAAWFESHTERRLAALKRFLERARN